MPHASIESTREHMKTHCVGRFSVTSPEELVETGRSQSIYRIEVETIPVPQDKANEYWLGRLGAIRVECIKRGGDLRPPREVEIGPAISAILFLQNTSFPNLATVEAIKPFETHIVHLKFEGKTDKEENIRRVMKATFDGYAPGIFKGFCVGAGSITTEPSRYETARVAFKNAAIGIELTISTQTVGDIRSKPPLDDIEEKKWGLASSGVKLNVLSNRPRTVANLEGLEGRVSLESAEKHELSFTWFFRGVAGASDKPEIRVEASSSAKQKESLEATWEAILGSLKPVEASN